MNVTILMQISHFSFDNVVIKAFCNCLRHKEKLCDKFVGIEEKRGREEDGSIWAHELRQIALCKMHNKMLKDFAEDKESQLLVKRFTQLYKENISHSAFHNISRNRHDGNDKWKSHSFILSMHCISLLFATNVDYKEEEKDEEAFSFLFECKSAFLSFLISL